MPWYAPILTALASAVSAIVEYATRSKAAPEPIETPPEPGFAGIDAEEDAAVKRKPDAAPVTPRNT